MAQQITAENQVIDIMRSRGTCDLEEITRRCPSLTWNQVFFVVDRLSRTGRIKLLPAKGGNYTLTLLGQQGNRPDQHSIPSSS